MKRLPIRNLINKIEFLKQDPTAGKVSGWGGDTWDEFYIFVGINGRSLRDCFKIAPDGALNKKNQLIFAKKFQFEIEWFEWTKGSSDDFEKRYLNKHTGLGSDNEVHRTPLVSLSDLGADNAPDDAAKNSVNSAVAPGDGEKLADAEVNPRAMEAVAKLIRKAPHVLRLLQQQQGMEGLPLEVSKEGDEDPVLSAARWLLQADMVDVINACYVVFDDADKESDDGTLQAAVVRELAERIIPERYGSGGYDYGAVAKVKSELSRRVGDVVEIQVHHKGVAELVVAAAESRPPSYLPRNNPAEKPIGTNSFIDHTPDWGIDAEEEWLNGVRLQWDRRFEPQCAEEIYDNIRAFVAGCKYYVPDVGATFSPDQLFELAGEKFKRLSRKRTFYMTFHVQDKDKAALNSMIEKLSNKLPGMLFLVLNKNFELANEENQRFGGFFDMLPCGGTGKTPNAKA